VEVLLSHDADVLPQNDGILDDTHIVICSQHLVFLLRVTYEIGT